MVRRKLTRVAVFIRVAILSRWFWQVLLQNYDLLRRVDIFWSSLSHRPVSVRRKRSSTNFKFTCTKREFLSPHVIMTLETPKNSLELPKSNQFVDWIFAITVSGHGAADHVCFVLRNSAIQSVLFMLRAVLETAPKCNWRSSSQVPKRRCKYEEQAMHLLVFGSWITNQNVNDFHYQSFSFRTEHLLQVETLRRRRRERGRPSRWHLCMCFPSAFHWTPDSSEDEEGGPNGSSRRRANPREEGNKVDYDDGLSCVIVVYNGFLVAHF